MAAGASETFSAWHPFVVETEITETAIKEPPTPRTRGAIPTMLNTPILHQLRVAGFEDSLSDEAQALYRRPLKSTSQARRASQPGRGRSRKDEAANEHFQPATRVQFGLGAILHTPILHHSGWPDSRTRTTTRTSTKRWLEGGRELLSDFSRK